MKGKVRKNPNYREKFCERGAGREVIKKAKKAKRPGKMIAIEEKRQRRVLTDV